jgi:hypothetical protein
MLRHRLLLACHAAVLVFAAPAIAADISECLQLETRPGADAALSNVCIDWLNVMYCVDGAHDGAACADKPKDVITLVPGNSVALPGYDGGTGSLRWAVCAYPAAPVGWEPARGPAYTCKKTCVMC